MRYLVISSMRNEGAFIVEWVAWYRALGFSDILIVTNGCTDHSPELLDLLAAKGWVTHLRKEAAPGVPPLRAKLRAARRHPLVAAADWILVCDVDEFLVVHKGAGQIADLLPEVDPGYLGMAINWRVFGSSGQQHWQPGLTHRQFTRAAMRSDMSSRWIKSIFRRPELFARFGAHGPDGADLAAIPGGGAEMWVDSSGAPLPRWQPDGPYMRTVPRQHVTWRAAQINHYMVRSLESFELKRGMPSAAAAKDRYTDAYLEAYDRNEVEDLCALRRRWRFDREYAAAMALPGLARLHHLCCADHVAALADKIGFSAEADARYRAALAAAAPASG
ncbi:MAG: glycosyltransferase family 2 protein [Phaeovulum sp.]|uniref:glycosyltransferase family 2 protein n=2 Tax=Phaeovulum sp. TaxID=2934796 RepID=UPI00272FA1E7|nr:glycosyltransferase family 2 protein [Phaeovulum sp.]MDP2062279.1 glycosyltransferase family 2 protein [Phaeovulum sp.]